MLKKSLILFLNVIIGSTILFTRGEARACSCDDGGRFLKVAPGADLLVQARVVRHKDPITGPGLKKPLPTAMELAIIKVYRGRETRRTITVLGDRGADCLEYVNHFKVGSTWFFALHNVARAGAKVSPTCCRVDKRKRGGRLYAVSSCGIYAMQRIGDQVVELRSGPRELPRARPVPLKRFLEQLERLPRPPAPKK